MKQNDALVPWTSVATQHAAGKAAVYTIVTHEVVIVALLLTATTKQLTVLLQYSIQLLKNS